MADATMKKGGFRAFFGKRSNDDSNLRKKLSKKALQGQASGAEKLGGQFVANPNRSDSGSFTSQSIHSTNEEFGLPTYNDVTASKSHGYRDSPYAAAQSLGHARSYPQQVPHLEEYRRNSEGQQQYAAPLYRAHTSRSASVPHFGDAMTLEKSEHAAMAKASSTKLTKANKKPRLDDILDKDTGERKDLTDMMHAFTFNEELDTIEEKHYDMSLDYDPDKPDGTTMLSGVSPEVWLRVSDFLTPLDVANLSSTCRTLSKRALCTNCM